MDVFESELLSSSGLMDVIINALDRKIPFSVVSAGVTEMFVLAQYTILKEEEFLGHKEAYVAAQGAKRGFDHRGVRFPNIPARDAAVGALTLADAIGYNMFLLKCELTKKVWNYYNFKPKYVFEAHIRRVIMFSQQEKFQRMLANKKILLMCSYANEVKTSMEKDLQECLGFEIVGTINIEEFEDIPRVKEELSHFNFDLCLLAAGINAVILAPHIAKTYGKVAIDLGLGMESFITRKIEFVNYLGRDITKLMSM